jgi:hypothetical protein
VEEALKTTGLRSTLRLMRHVDYKRPCDFESTSALFITGAVAL